MNSKNNDFGLIITKSGSKGFFSSNRKRGGTDDDLFMFVRKPEDQHVKLNVFVYKETKLDTLYGIIPVVSETTSGDRLTFKKKLGLYTYSVKKGTTYTASAESDDQNVTRSIVIPRNVKSLTLGLPIPEVVVPVQIVKDEIPASAFEI